MEWEDVFVCYCGIGVVFEFVFFFFNDTATTEIYTLSLHDALPICKNIFIFMKIIQQHFFNKLYQ